MNLKWLKIEFIYFFIVLSTAERVERIRGDDEYVFDYTSCMLETIRNTGLRYNTTTNNGTYDSNSIIHVSDKNMCGSSGGIGYGAGIHQEQMYRQGAWWVNLSTCGAITDAVSSNNSINKVIDFTKTPQTPLWSPLLIPNPITTSTVATYDMWLYHPGGLWGKKGQEDSSGLRYNGSQTIDLLVLSSKPIAHVSGIGYTTEHLTSRDSNRHMCDYVFRLEYHAMYGIRLRICSTSNSPRRPSMVQAN